jgi:hypothetical protein
MRAVSRNFLSFSIVDGALSFGTLVAASVAQAPFGVFMPPATPGGSR